MRLLRTNSSKTTFEESLVKFKQRLRTRGYPKTVIERSLSGVNFAARPSALTQKKKANERILPFVTTYHPAVSNLKQFEGVVLMCEPASHASHNASHASHASQGASHAMKNEK